MSSTHQNKKLALSPPRILATLSVSLLIFVLCLGLFGINVSQAMGNDIAKAYQSYRCCSKTALAAFTACHHEIMDNYWISVGKCNNLSGPDERRECLAGAKDELKDAKELCKDQLDARLDVCKEIGEAAYDPQLDPKNFVDPETISKSTANKYFPLISGTQWIYEGETGEGFERITVKVTGEIKEIEYPQESGRIFKCLVVCDVVTLNGEVVEDTEDWYAQDKEGNVWYFGEISKGFENGELVTIDGSWKAGREDAKPGVVMRANPKEGDYYRQEFFLGDAEDMAGIVGRGVESVTVPFGGTYTIDVLKTKEFTPIEPDAFEYKYYAPGVGLILELNPESGERIGLIDMTMP